MPNHEAKIGALWERTSKGGKTYWSGTIDGVGKVVVFTNSYKTEDKHPTHIVYRSEDRQQAQQAEAPRPPQTRQMQDVPEDTSIPF